jgi:branched-chain amino acid transport system substrate-binding protein
MPLASPDEGSKARAGFNPGGFTMKMKRLLISSAIFLASFTSSHAEAVAKVGVIYDFSGPYADIGGQGAVLAARMAIEDFGAGNGVRGEVVWADHLNKTDVAVNIARHWYDQDGVEAIFGVGNSGIALALSALAREKNKVLIDTASATSDLTGPKCSPNTIHWTYDTWELAHGTGSATVKAGGKTWFFVTADYAFGAALQSDTAAVVIAEGGKVLGSVKHPLSTQDFSSFLLQAQSSGAQVIGLANTGGNAINAVKQASEFGIVQKGQKLVGLLVFITDVHAMGLKTAQGLLLTSPFYWELNDGTRVFSDRFMKVMNRRPTMVQAGVYSAVLHYLKAVSAAGSAKDALKVIGKMKETPAEDPLFGKTTVRADGRAIHDSYLFEVKKPEESKGPWDYYKLISTTPAERAFRPMSEGGCPLVAGSPQLAGK